MGDFFELQYRRLSARPVPEFCWGVLQECSHRPLGQQTVPILPVEILYILLLLGCLVQGSFLSLKSSAPLLYLRKSIFLFKVSSQEQFKIFLYNYAALNICPYIKKLLQWPLIRNQGSLVCLFRSSTSEIIAQSFQVVKHVEMRGEWCTWRGPGSSLPFDTYCALCISSTWLSF